jgi:hypothetical protein
MLKLIRVIDKRTVFLRAATGSASETMKRLSSSSIGLASSVTLGLSACLLRVSAATGGVDPGFYVDLLRAADARAITSAFYLGDGRWLMNVWPNSVPPLSAAAIEAEPEAYFSAASFEYVVIVDLEDGTRIPVSGLSCGTYGGLTPMYLDGLPLVQLFPNDGGGETGALLYEVKPSGEARRVLQAGSNGDFEFIGRLR